MTYTNASGAQTSFQLPGPCVLEVTGTFNGATVNLQASLDNATWSDLRDSAGAVIAVTVNRLLGIDLPRGYFLRANVSTGTATSLTLSPTPV